MKPEHAAHARSRTRPSLNDSVAALVAIGVLVVGMVVVRDGTVPGWERRIFDAVNGLPDWLYPALWPFQQLGALAVAPVLALVALVLGRRRLALAIMVALVAKLVLERVVKLIVTRERPGTSIGAGADLRGDVSAAGESFVSGHAVLVAAIAGVIAPRLPERWRFVPWVVVVLVAFTRVYVGAHNPLDVVCGAALGFAIAVAVNWLIPPRGVWG